MSSDIILTPEQLNAIDYICEELKDGKKLLAVRGLAGCGKSVIIPHLRSAIEDHLQRKVAVGAPTHRAAMVLKQKQVPDADTIHSLALRPRFDDAYNDACGMLGKPIHAPTLDEHDSPVLPPYDDTESSLIAEAKRTWLLGSAFPDRDALKHRAATFGAGKALRSIGINGRDHIVGQEAKPNPGSILLCDEGSMVGRELLDLCERSYEAVVLIGDPGQLPPVKDVAVLHSLEGITLNTIHRQAAGSSILRLAYDARAGKAQWRGHQNAYAPDVCYAEYAPVTQLGNVPVLVWRNSVRLEVTKAVRAGLGYDDLHLHVGEPLVCRTQDRNDRVDGLYTNAQFRIVEVDASMPRTVMVAPEGEPDAYQIVTVHMEEDGPYCPPGAVPFRYGYSLTVHGAQGSEWPRVVVDLQDLLAQQGASYRRGELDDAARFQYTSVTRAKEQLILLTQRVFR